jgi:hypothetical protein
VMWNVVLLARRLDTSYVTGVLTASLYHPTPPHLFDPMYYWEFMQEGVVQRKTRIILSRTGHVVLFFFVCFCSIWLFLVICRSESGNVWASSSENSSYTFFCHDTDCHFVTGYTEPYTHSSHLSYTEHFGKYPISGMVD